MPVSGTEADLLREVLEGSRGAKDALAREYAPRLAKFVALMGVQDVDDVVQEALTEALGSLASFRGRSKFSSWMLSVALNRCRRWHRSRHSRIATASEGTLDRPDPNVPWRSVLSNLVRRESADRISLALDRLPPAFREAFVLKHVEGLDYREIAEIAGVTESTARVRAHRGKLLLQTDLGDEFATFLGLASIPGAT
jgi:RNA polymerase sigma-70 factor (ECF subfamily)